MTLSKFLLVSCFGAVALVGCETIRNAREAQDACREKGDERCARSALPLLDVSGLTLGELVDFALTNRPSVVSKRLEVEDARLALVQLRADAPLVSETPWTAPQLSLSGRYTEASAGTTLDRHDFRTAGDPSAGLSLSVLIWDFGRYDARAAAQSEKVIAAEYALVEEGYTVFGEVASAYFGFLERAALLETAITNQFEYASHLERTMAMADAGEARNLDVLKARYDLASARERTVSASNAVTTAAVELTRSLGLEDGCVAAEDFERLADGALSRLVRVIPETTVGSTAAFEFARTNAPAMRIVRSRLRSAQANVDYAVADLKPELTASAGLSWTNPLWAWNWGLSAVQSLFQGFSKTTAVDRSVVALESAAADVDEAEQRLSADLAAAIAGRDNAQTLMKTVAESLEAAKENLDTVRERFEIGDATRVDYATAVSSYVETLGNAVTAFYGEQRSEVDLIKLLGVKPAYER